MSSPPKYSSLSEPFAAELPQASRRSLDQGSNASSDIIYRDALDIEPFGDAVDGADDEKTALRSGSKEASAAARYRDDFLGAEGRAEEGDQLWSESRRVRPSNTTACHAWWSEVAC